ncbi:LacI family DNA-binding transcriptional regulator [Deinococcus yavapaiensis]|uniref:LacI family transcriptional regulator n=1 Tax=Deinococcus yavapaiensis KR-236 TaxID=694435 RepID=A0A318S748_9DEIO|nr:LacI family DNA-binding transcriptional regulator [Deinococcus yavapaiensis]PYE51010.1 LacI family transcriptional regulator [Deinococcus yavapaiensis KR-236]
MKRATIKDVAAYAGVSFKTVSYVLNGGDKVSDKTRNAVLEAVRSLDYQPHRAARAMRTGQAFSIALVGYGQNDIPSYGNLADPAIALIVAAMAATAEARGYTLSLSNFTRSDLSAYERGLAQGQFDGGIFIPFANNPGALEPFLSSPLVVIDQPNLPNDVPVVCVDYRSGVREAVTHLAARGRRRIGFIGGPRDLNAYHNTERYGGYFDGLTTNGLTLDDALVVAADYSFEGARAVARALLTAKPDAIVAASDRMAIGALREAHALGLRVPEDLAIVGFDDLEAARYVDPPLTTVHHPLTDLGRHAAEMMLARIENRLPADQRRATLRTHLVVRASS